jgi:hypothetical protein
LSLQLTLPQLEPLLLLQPLVTRLAVLLLPFEQTPLFQDYFQRLLWLMNVG